MIHSSNHQKLSEIIGGSKALDYIKKIIAKVAESNSTVLIRGETGTGKELIARAIHGISPRAAERFQAVNCAAINENLLESELFGHMRGAFTGAVGEKKGLFEIADKGTLFLDEIGDLNISLQAKLLRALQEKEILRVGGINSIKVDVRVLAATNRDLEAMVKDNRFREDLYYRLNVIPIIVPPLHQRRDDIPMLMDHFLCKYSVDANCPMKVSSEARNLLMEYSWPGNVRQLESTIERAVLLAEGDEIVPEDLSCEIIAHAESMVHTTSPQIAVSLKRKAKLGHPLIEILDSFRYPPALVAPKLGEKAKHWVDSLGRPKIVIVDDYQDNVQNYQAASNYLCGSLNSIFEHSGCAPEICVVRPSSLPRNRVELRNILKSCVLVVADLDFTSDSEVWPNGYVLLAYIADACPWLVKGTLWVTQTDPDVFRSGYFTDALNFLSLDRDLSHRARRILRDINVDVHRAEGRPIPPYGDYINEEERAWWKYLAQNIANVLRNQERLINDWMESRTTPDAEAANKDTPPSERQPLVNTQDKMLQVEQAANWLIEKLESLRNSALPCSSTDIKRAFALVRQNYKEELDSAGRDREWAKTCYSYIIDRLEQMANNGNLHDIRRKPADRNTILMNVRRHYWYRDALPKQHRGKAQDRTRKPRK